MDYKDPNFWMSLTGAITGIIVTITGIISYKKTTSIKRIDLNLEKGKLENFLTNKIKQIPELILEADSSKKGVLNLTGRFHSGLMERWKIELEEKNSDFKKIKKDFEEGNEKSSKNNNLKNIQSLIINYHEFETKLDSIIDFLNKSLDSDKSERERVLAERNSLRK